MSKTKARPLSDASLPHKRTVSPQAQEEFWEAWSGIPRPLFSPLQPVVLVGLDSIARAVGAGQLAIRRWIKEENFPARRCTDGIYRADPEAVRRWFGNGSSRQP